MPRSSWMHLDLDAFFASVEVKLDPSLKGKPVLVGGVNPQGKNVPRGVVATASYEARKFGCRSGMPLFQALRLCPKAVVVGGHYEEYIRASDQVFDIAARYAPKIQRVGIDEAFLDFSNTEIIYPDLVEIANKIRTEIKKEVGITASIGVAATRIVAKVASDFHKPDGVTYVPEGKEKSFLAPLPIEDLPGIGRKMSIYFHRLGVKKLGELANVDLKRIEGWGKFVVNLWQAANGVDNLWFSERVEVKSVSRSETFDKNSKDKKFILAMLQYLTEKVGTEMRAEGYFGKCVYVAIRYGDFRTLSRQRVLPYPTNSTKEVYEMAETLALELWDGKGELRLVGIGMSQFARLDGQDSEQIQGSLFDGVREKRLGLEERIDELRNRFGKEAVLPGSLIKLKSSRPSFHPKN